MSARELYKNYQILADAAAQPHLSAPKFARLYWLCSIEWLRELARHPKSELVSRAARPFTRQFIGSGRVILWELISPVPLTIRAVRVDLGGERIGMPCAPTDSDELGVIEQDPFRRASDDNPRYSEELDHLITVHSDSIPTRTLVAYWCYPVELDMSADNTPLETVDSQWQILRRTIAEKDLIDEKYNRYQLLSSRAIPVAEQTL